MSSWSDDAGRIAISTLEFSASKIALVSAYAPNHFDGNVYNTLSSQMLELTDFSFIVGAYFNAVWDPNVNQSNAKATGEQAQATKALTSWAISLGLIDI